MTGKAKSGASPAPGAARAERLAAALRANLKRRKQQARVRAAQNQESAAPRAPARKPAGE